MNYSAAVLTRLRATGWKQNENGPFDGPNCLNGALAIETRDHHLKAKTGFVPIVTDPSGMARFGAVLRLLETIIEQMYPDEPSRQAECGNCCLSCWNDAPGRTFAQVEELLQKGIAKEEECPVP